MRELGELVRQLLREGTGEYDVAETLDLSVEDVRRFA